MIKVLTIPRCKPAIKGISSWVSLLRDLEFGSGKQRAASGLIQILTNKLGVFPAITAGIPVFFAPAARFPIKNSVFCQIPGLLHYLAKVTLLNQDLARTRGGARRT